MGNFRSDNRDRGFSRDRGRSRNRSFGERSSGRSRGGGGFRDRGDSESFERRRPEMHEVTCDKCGKQCEVPFRPTEGKPVFCSDCFSSNSPRSGSKDNSSSSGISEEQYKELNTKLDKILGILETLEIVDEEDSEDDSEDEEK